MGFLKSIYFTQYFGGASLIGSFVFESPLAALIWASVRNMLFTRLAPLISASRKSDPMRSAQLKSTPLRFAAIRQAPLRSAPIRLAFLRSAPK